MYPKFRHTEEYGAMPEMIDDFIRNYLSQIGLYQTLASVSISAYFGCGENVTLYNHENIILYSQKIKKNEY